MNAPTSTDDPDALLDEIERLLGELPDLFERYERAVTLRMNPAERRAQLHAV